MTTAYLSKGFTINPHQQTIERNGHVVSVRPKTFALLLLLLERPQEVLSKRYLLDTVWDDVVVDEPVLVQSIRELRQLFDDQDIIQTYPRKGYAWSAEVQKQFLDKPDATETLQIPNKNRMRWSSYVALAITLLIFVFLVRTNYFSPEPSSAEVIIVLPVKNEVAGNDHNWVSLGTMDQLIHLLKADTRIHVMDTEYVLQLMQYTNTPRTYSEQQANRIFEVSGASLVIETKISGSVEDYRLDYKLRRKNDIQVGVIFDNNLDGGLQKLRSIVADYSGMPITSVDVLAQHAFRNELMSRALEQMDTGELQLANNLLSSLKQLEPDNIIARRMLAKTLLDLKQYDSAKNEILPILAVASRNDSARLYFLLAEIQFQQGLFDSALATLVSAETTSQSINDTLYLGYITQLRANIQEQLGLLEPALVSYEQAIKHFSIIRCPIGASITHLKLINLFLKQGKLALANEQYLIAKQLIEGHQLHTLEPWLAKMNAIAHSHH